jgi:hypothetical protein
LKHHIPIPFSLPELMALYFGSDILEVFKGTFFHDSLESLFQKIKTTLPAESLRYLSSDQKTLHVELRPYKEYGKFKEIINLGWRRTPKQATVELALPQSRPWIRTGNYDTFWKKSIMKTVHRGLRYH